jgi:dephospho-CoA kinase
MLIGLTGGIGSGKSTVAQYIQSKGYPVYFADIEAKKVMERAEVIEKIVTLFGEEILENGKINKIKLANIVFENTSSLNALNNIIHPAVAKDFESWRENHSTSSLIFKEAAILFESGSYKDCDKIITITAPKDIRIHRVLERDQTNEEDVEKRMKHQWDEDKKISFSDFTIVNLNLQDTFKKVDIILKELDI